ncbi:MAG: hypothetical protein WA985_09335 [Erythrobacter sp.]|uniref:hypothetical protein n=1 Tax=Erythrobacter sp. TaxID=1042 RepID=UPI003C72C0E6
MLATGAAAMAFSAVPAQAQFGKIFRDAQRGAQRAEGCEEGRSGDTARGILGGILGGAANRTARRARLPIYSPVSAFTNQLTTEIACILDPKEQEKAAEATVAVTSVVDEEGNDTQPEVGRSAAWTSDTREGVSGSSTVTSREASSGGNDCITVTDVVIVEGEETRAEKRMCRLAGSPRYAIVA